MPENFPLRPETEPVRSDGAALYEHTEVGYNYRLSNALAAFGRAQRAILEK